MKSDWADPHLQGAQDSRGLLHQPKTDSRGFHPCWEVRGLCTSPKMMSQGRAQVRQEHRLKQMPREGSEGKGPSCPCRMGRTGTGAAAESGQTNTEPRPPRETLGQPGPQL